MKLRKITAAVCIAAVTVCTVSAGAEDIPSWAESGVKYCMNNGIVSGYDDGTLRLSNSVTKAESAKILVEAFDLCGDADVSAYAADAASVPGISAGHWAYDYARALYKATNADSSDFSPSQPITREEFAALLVLAKGYTASSVQNPTIIDDNFTDYASVSDKYKKLVTVAVERGLLKGIDGKIEPKETLTRAQVCVFTERAVKGVTDPLELGVIQSRTPIIGTASVTLEQAKAWAKSRGAADIYIDIADTYWKYGELTGIRPDVLYAQAGLETGYGKYGNRVTADMNNWAGIKKYGHDGDEKDDHESFATPDDGVRAHFNHMSAYVGLAPIGEPHERYKSVMTLSWAGKVKYLEELGGKWCPNLYYGFMILHGCIEPMQKM